jgi:hypothetical protein
VLRHRGNFISVVIKLIHVERIKRCINSWSFNYALSTAEIQSFKPFEKMAITDFSIGLLNDFFFSCSGWSNGTMTANDELGKM